MSREIVRAVKAEEIPVCSGCGVRKRLKLCAMVRPPIAAIVARRKSSGGGAVDSRDVKEWCVLHVPLGAYFDSHTPRAIKIRVALVKTKR